MKIRIPVQLIVAAGIVLIGGGALLTEYILVKWWPLHRQNVADSMTELLPYRNDSLGIKMQVARAIYGKVQDFPSGAKIYRSEVFHDGPVLTLTSQANPDAASEFSPQLMATWETRGVYEKIPDYNFQHLQIENRDAALISQSQNEGYLVTAHIISPDRIIEANCTTGNEYVQVMLQACEASLETIQVAGPMPPPKAPAGVMELEPVKPAPPKH
jgi:hypothetical protein